MKLIEFTYDGKRTVGRVVGKNVAWVEQTETNRIERRLAPLYMLKNVKILKMQ